MYSPCDTEISPFTFLYLSFLICDMRVTINIYLSGLFWGLQEMVCKGLAQSRGLENGYS